MSPEAVFLIATDRLEGATHIYWVEARDAVRPAMHRTTLTAKHHPIQTASCAGIETPGSKSMHSTCGDYVT